MKNRRLAEYAIIVASYTAISILMGSFSFGMVQIRIAEVLLVLCLYDKKYIVPVTLGCFVTNFVGIINGLNPLVLDLFIGTLATLLSALGVYYFSNIRFYGLPLLSLFIPAVINGVMVGLELCLYFSMSPIILMVYVFLGEMVSVTILGLLLYKPIGKVIKQYIE